MKSFRKLKEEISNVSSGIGVRGFGDVSGEPKIDTGSDDETNPHIERVVAGANENNKEVKNFIKNNLSGLYPTDSDDWWAKSGAKGTNLTSLGKPTKTNLSEEHKNLSSYVIKNFTSNQIAYMLGGHLLEEIGGMSGTVGGTSVGTGYIAGVGVPLEGKPSNWSEPGVYMNSRKKHKIRTRAKPKEVGTAMKEIPIQEELKTGMFAGEQTFIVPSHVYEKSVMAKTKGKHWRTYIEDEYFHPSIREYAYKNPSKPIIFEDEKTGCMCYARYGKKRK